MLEALEPTVVWGLVDACRKVEDITVEIWDRELGVHAKGVFLGTRTAIPAKRKGEMEVPVVPTHVA